MLVNRVLFGYQYYDKRSFVSEKELRQDNRVYPKDTLIRDNSDQILRHRIFWCRQRIQLHVIVLYGLHISAAEGNRDQ